MCTLQASDRQEEFGFKSKASVRGHSFTAISYNTFSHSVSPLHLTLLWPFRTHTTEDTNTAPGGARINTTVNGADLLLAACGFNPHEVMVKAAV